jgi:hypothetical protein
MVGPHFPVQLDYPQLDAYGGEDAQFTVSNEGKAAAPPFRIAILAGSLSYSIYADAIPAGSYAKFTMNTDIENCGNAITIIVDPQGLVDEGSSPGKHVLTTYGYCNP